jgi:hypothetical protein
MSARARARCWKSPSALRVADRAEKTAERARFARDGCWTERRHAVTRKPCRHLGDADGASSHRGPPVPCTCTSTNARQDENSPEGGRAFAAPTSRGPATISEMRSGPRSPASVPVRCDPAAPVARRTGRRGAHTTSGARPTLRPRAGIAGALARRITSRSSGCRQARRSQPRRRRQNHRRRGCQRAETVCRPEILIEREQRPAEFERA